MYTSLFAEPDLPTMLDFIETHSFGMLVSQVQCLPCATHLPFLLDRSSGTHGELVGHMARSNPQRPELSGQIALAIFSGPHAYISPTWYDAEHVVPTWNYADVHVHGRLEVIEDPAALWEIVEQTVRFHEKTMPKPWALDATTYSNRLLSQIVGFRLRIERLEGKWKLSQYHPIERREKVVRELRKHNDENSLAIAAMMEKMLASSS